MKSSFRFLGFFLILSACFLSCKKDYPEQQFPANTNFVSATRVGSFTKSELQAMGTKSGYGVLAGLAKYDVDYYKLIYKSTFKGQPIQLSGLIGIPKNSPKAPSILSAQHTEMFRFADAPSNFPKVFTGLEIFASIGFIDLMPDYIGFGISSNVVHPFYHKSTSTLAVLDMIEAAKFFLNTKKINYNPKLYLAGYGEGGYISHATQQMIEADTSYQLTLSGTVAGGFATYPTEFLGSYLAYQSVFSPAFFINLVNSYNHFYGWNQSNADLYVPTFLPKIPALLDGTKTRAQIDQELTRDLPELLTQSFYLGLRGGPGPDFIPAAQVKKAANLNAIGVQFGYPRTPTRFYHGQADEVVIYGIISSTEWYNLYYTNPRPQLVKVFTLPNGTHDSVEKTTFESAAQWFLEWDK